MAYISVDAGRFYSVSGESSLGEVRCDKVGVDPVCGKVKLS